MEIVPYPLDPRYGASRDGRVWRIVRARFGKAVPHEVKPVRNKKGYLIVGSGKRSGLTTIAAHRLVALTFIPNPEVLPEVGHNDGSKDNNAVENLRWTTYAGNQADRLRHGTHNRGTRQTNHKLTEADVEALRLGKLTPAEASAKSGADVKHCFYVARGKDWPHVQPR